jgi:hypothetical protein
MLRLAMSLKRKRGEEASKSTSSKASSGPPETHSPGHSPQALEQPSLSKRRRLETWSDSPALRLLLPSSDELSSSGICFHFPLTVQAAHDFTQMMPNLKKFRDPTIQQPLRAASPLLPFIHRLPAPTTQGVVGDRLSIFFGDLICFIQTRAQLRLIWNGSKSVNNLVYARSLFPSFRWFQPSQSSTRVSTFPI